MIYRACLYRGTYTKYQPIVKCNALCVHISLMSPPSRLNIRFNDLAFNEIGSLSLLYDWFSKIKHPLYYSFPFLSDACHRSYKQLSPSLCVSNNFVRPYVCLCVCASVPPCLCRLSGVNWLLGMAYTSAYCHWRCCFASLWQWRQLVLRVGDKTIGIVDTIERLRDRPFQSYRIARDTVAFLFHSYFCSTTVSFAKKNRSTSYQLGATQHIDCVKICCFPTYAAQVPAPLLVSRHWNYRAGTQTITNTRQQQKGTERQNSWDRVEFGPQKEQHVWK